MKGGFIPIQQWMLDFGMELDCTVAFAVVFAFTQNVGGFYYSPKTIANWCATTPKDAKGILDYLVEQGFLLIKRWYYQERTIVCYYVNAAVLPEEYQPSVRKKIESMPKPSFTKK